MNGVYMTEEEYNKLDKKRNIKKINGMDTTKETLEQVSHIEDVFDEMEKSGVFNELKKKEEEYYNKFLRECNITLSGDSETDFKAIIPKLAERFESEGCHSTTISPFKIASIHKLRVTLIRVVEMVNSYCERNTEPDNAMETVEAYDALPFTDMYESGITKSNFDEFLTLVYSTTRNILNDIMAYYRYKNPARMAYLASLLPIMFFYISEVVTQMEYGFENE